MKKYKIIFLTILFCFLLTGCEKDVKLNLQEFNLNFRYFVLPNTESIQSTKAEEINLIENITFTDIINHSNMISNIYNICASYDFYTNNFDNKDNFYNKIEEYVIYINKLKENNDFKESIDNIYNLNDTYYYETRVISINQEGQDLFYEVEIISTNSDEFLLEYVYVYIQETDYTTKKIDFESLLDKNIHSDFYNDYMNLINKLSNSSLYEKYNLIQNENIILTNEEINLTEEDLQNINELEIQIDTLIENYNKNYNLDFETLKHFYLKGEGSFKNTFVIKYKIHDYNATALSIYTIKTIQNGISYKYEITYDRIEEKITNITLLKE